MTPFLEGLFLLRHTCLCQNIYSYNVTAWRWSLTKQEEFINQEDHSMVRCLPSIHYRQCQQEVRAPESISRLGKMPPQQQRNGECKRGAALHFQCLMEVTGEWTDKAPLWSVRQHSNWQCQSPQLKYFSAMLMHLSQLIQNYNPQPSPESHRCPQCMASMHLLPRVVFHARWTQEKKLAGLLGLLDCFTRGTGSEQKEAHVLWA